MSELITGEVLPAAVDVIAPRTGGDTTSNDGVILATVIALQEADTSRLLLDVFYQEAFDSFAIFASLRESRCEQLKFQFQLQRRNQNKTSFRIITKQ